jgi:lipid-A-disaccharide synthase
MRGEGLDVLFPTADISVMGFAEVVPHIPRIMRRMRQATAAVAATRPDALVTIDAQVFSAMLARRAKRAAPDTALVQYVAPTVWAWKPWRAAKAAKIYDRMLTLLPFEPPYFERVGLEADYVGHPVVERVASLADDAPRALRDTLGIAPDAPVLLVAPGSRQSEISRLLDPFGEAALLLSQRLPGLQVIVPVAEGVADRVERTVSGWDVPVHLMRAGGMSAEEAEHRKFAAFGAADLALVASGTVALEVAAMGTPMIVGYRVRKSSEWLVRRLVNVRSFTLVNLMVGRKAIPELLQERCTGPRLADALMAVLEDSTDQHAAFEEAFATFGDTGAPPSTRAARGVLTAIAQKKRQPPV